MTLLDHSSLKALAKDPAINCNSPGGSDSAIRVSSGILMPVSGKLGEPNLYLASLSHQEKQS
jgi:hypothetical protein